MKKFLLVLSLIGLTYTKNVSAQMIPVENVYQDAFNEAYQLYPDIPKGILEAVSYQQTRMSHLTEDLPVSCTGMPQYLGVMGLIENGKGYFNENLQLIHIHSGFPIEVLKHNPHEEILAFAKTYQDFIILNSANTLEEKISVLKFLSEIPIYSTSEGNIFAMNTHLYGIVQFMTNPEMQAYYSFPNPRIDVNVLFGDNYDILSSKHIEVHKDHIEDENHHFFKSSEGSVIQKSADYGPALWNPAAACNYSSRSGVAVSAITVHTVQGSYAGCISWFQNCAASVSCHYVMRSSDGQVTQQVLEADKAWHVGSNNPYTVGIEHEGYVNNPAWYTTAMYNSSSALSIDIANSHGINKIRTGWWPWLSSVNYNIDGIPGSCVYIKGHQHYPNQTHTDPGINWDWNRYYKLINTPPSATMLTAASGSFFDSGGAGANYINDERSITTIAPAGAVTVSVTFSSFNLENTWDYLYIYDGANINAPLIGYYTGTTNPGTITSSGSSLTFEFRSDCATLAPGWAATYTGTTGPSAPDSIAPVTSVSVPNNWQTEDFDASFADADEVGGSGLKKSFYHVSYFDGDELLANTSRGFLRDEFDLITLNPQWTVATGFWNMAGSYVEQTDEAISNTNMYASLKQDLSNIYVYEFTAAIGGGGANRRAGFHFFCDSAQLTNRGNSYFVWFRQDQQEVEIYKVTNDVFTLMHSESLTMIADQWYNYKVFYDRVTGEIRVYRDNVIISEWTDPSPYSNGKYVSFRSGNANFKVGNIRVYRSRYSNSATNITVGNCAVCDLPFQNSSPSIPAGYIYSFSNDSSDNLSAIVVENIDVDWTPPAPLNYVNDISIFDEDTITNNNLAGGYWNAASDTNSAIAGYYYSIGTTSGDSDVVSWQDNWFYTNFLDTISLITNQWYYINAKSVNGAGLLSTTASSDGFIFVNLGDENLSTSTLHVYPNPASEYIYLHGFDAKDLYTIEWMDLKGAVIHTEKIGVNTADVMINVPDGLSTAFYILSIRSDERFYRYRIEVLR